MIYGMHTAIKYMTAIWYEYHGGPPATIFDWVTDISEQMVTDTGDKIIFAE